MTTSKKITAGVAAALVAGGAALLVNRPAVVVSPPVTRTLAWNWQDWSATNGWVVTVWRTFGFPAQWELVATTTATTQTVDVTRNPVFFALGYSNTLTGTVAP